MVLSLTKIGLSTIDLYAFSLKEDVGQNAVLRGTNPNQTHLCNKQ